MRAKLSDMTGRLAAPGLLLLADLRRLHRKVAGVSLDWELVAQGAQAVQDAALLAVAQKCHPQTLRQLTWTNAMLKVVSPQVLASRVPRGAAIGYALGMTTTVPHADRYLGLYLNDHLAGATAGTELAKRLAGEEKGQVGGQELARLADDVGEDRDALLAVMAKLDVPVRRYKEVLGWVGEKVGRLKLNGRVLTRSPLSRVVGLEAMLLGIEGKAALWRTLRARAASDSRLAVGSFDILIGRAREQAELVESLRVRAAAEAVGGDEAAATEAAIEPPREPS